MKSSQSIMTIDEIIEEWKSKNRRMGCVASAKWFCKRNKNFTPLRKRHYMQGGTDENGLFWEHVIVTDGIIEIDTNTYNNSPTM